MRRVLAALAAFAMLASGYLVYLGRTDRELPWSSGNEPTVSSDDSRPLPADTSAAMQFEISCPPEAELACAEADGVGESTFTVEGVDVTEANLGAKRDKAPDLWLTTALGFERVRYVRPDLRLVETVASSKVVVVTRTGTATPALACAAKLGCLTTAGRVAFPQLDRGDSLWISTSAIGTNVTGKSLDEIAGAAPRIEGLRLARRPRVVEAFSGLVSVRLYDAVVTTESSVKSVSPTGVDVAAADAPPVVYVLLASSNVGDADGKKVAASLRVSLANNGYSAATASTELPDPGLANEINERLR